LIFSDYKQNHSHGTGEFKLTQFRLLGENIVIENGVLVFHPENISIGSNVYIGHNTILKGYYKNEMIIGDHTWIGQSCYFHSAGGITIGKAVGIGPYVKILTSMHSENEQEKPILFHPLEFKKVTLEDGCDIGIGSIILPGITIGQGSIIGAGSVVTHDIPSFVIAAGVPARVQRKRKMKEVHG
jgi:acetyltransferase-like isoleucine patch superfamily enzyme